MRVKLLLIVVVCLSLAACKSNKPIVQYLPPSPVASETPASPGPTLDISTRITPDATPAISGTGNGVAKVDETNLEKFSNHRYPLPNNLNIQIMSSGDNFKKSGNAKDSKTGQTMQIDKEIDITYPQLTGFSDKDFEKQLNVAFISNITKDKFEKDGLNKYYYRQGFRIGHSVSNVCFIYLNAYQLIEGNPPLETTTSISFDCQSGQLYDTPTALQKLGYDSNGILASINKVIGTMKDGDGNPLKKLDIIPNDFYFDDNNGLVVVYNAMDTVTKAQKPIPFTITKKI